MRILGIDPGSAKCGWAIIEKNRSGKLKLVDCGCIKTSPKASDADRLLHIYNDLKSIIRRFKPDEMAIEELFFVQNVKTGIVVGQARGVILMCAAQAGLKIASYKPNVIKNSIVGYGHASKSQIQAMVKLELGLKEAIKQDDTADAVAVALCHIYHSNTRELSRMTREKNHSNQKSRMTREYKHANSDIVYPDLSYRIVGILQKVSNEIGFVLNERYYYPYIENGLKDGHILFDKQIPVNIELEGIRGRYFFDYLIENKIILEIKIGSRFSKKDVDQLMAYLRATGKRLGILARFTRSGVMTKRFLLGNKNIYV